ncbi:MAG: T9SS type A sorting domain-containing protein [Candidatus Hatepunaea meridiana]|nr:T9SS type A sorting domain-containing protein [Candidatus Hatepunaea meridiana]
MKTILSLFFLLSLYSFAGAAVPSFALKPVKSETVQEHKPGNTIQQTRTVHSTYPLRSLEPRRDDFLGERFIAGDTWYDYQTNGSLGKMIAVDPVGGVHITWTDSYTDDLNNGERHQQYNYFTADEEWIEDGGLQADFVNKGGFGCLYLTNEEVPRALSFFHGKIDTAWRSWCGVDLEAGFGVFESVLLPSFREQAIYFPQGVMSPEGRIHIATQRRDRGMIAYVQGEIDNDGWVVLGEHPIEVSETHRTNFRIACSPNDERTAIVWTYPREGIPAPDNWGNTVGYSMNCDLMLAWTDDGETWNFDDPLNVTDNIPPDPHLEGDAAYGDTLRPYANFDVIFDSENNIHIVFDSRGFWQQAIPEDEPPVDGITIDASVLFHWSEASEEITPVADGWYTHREVDEDDETIRWPTPSGWKSNVCCPSLAFDDEGDLYCVFNYYPLNDYSQEDYCNGDIAVTVSEDNGETWFLPTMITETRTHLAEEGESECELYSSLALVVDDYLHISYELDTEPGSTISDHTDRNEWLSLCPWVYHRVPVEDVEREAIWEDGPNWHARYASVQSGKSVQTPDHFKLENIYPNPFNATLNISYSLSVPSNISLRIYDITGHIVETLIDDNKQSAGSYSVVWDGGSAAAGIYFVGMEGIGGSVVRKVVLVK